LTNSFPSGIYIRLEYRSVIWRWRDARRKGKTFDVIVEGVRKHLIRQFGHGLGGLNLDYIVGGSADSGLTKPDENSGFSHGS
jgi:hypothetical protein